MLSYLNLFWLTGYFEHPHFNLCKLTQQIGKQFKDTPRPKYKYRNAATVNRKNVRNGIFCKLVVGKVKQKSNIQNDFVDPSIVFVKDGNFFHRSKRS